jgi:hypothetical protein
MLNSYPRAFFRAVLVLLLCFLARPGLAHEATEHFHSDVTTESKPWTHLEFQNDPDNFQFAVVSDRTGSPRRGVWEDAIKKLNLMMPEFVLSVGDLIKGTSENANTNSTEWDEMMDMLAPLKMPFFFTPGNHDIQMKWIKGRVQPEDMLAEWNARFGTTHFSFVYKNVLFVSLFSNDGKEQYISEEQAAYFDETVAANPDVRWTFLLLHHPLWAYPHETNFERIEKSLQQMKPRYTVLAGHHHRYVHFDRKKTDYIILASTGGGSAMRGPAYGEFDHFAWFTMTDDGPIMANLDLSGIYPKDVSQYESVEWVNDLQKSMVVGQQVLMQENHDGQVAAAALILNWRNHAKLPLRIRAEFSHSHHVHPNPGVIDEMVAPGASLTKEVNLAVLEPFARDTGILLELRTQAQLGDAEKGGLEMESSTAIPLVAGATDIFTTESIDFVGTARFRPPAASHEMTIRFTTDGSKPTADSAQLFEPLTLSAGTELMARAFSRSGIAGSVDSVTFNPTPAGQGLLAYYYGLGQSTKNLREMPDFSQVSPTLVRRVEDFDTAAVIRDETNFALVFQGWLSVEKDGIHEFHLESLDGARLLIDGKPVVDDAHKHPRREMTGAVRLEPGRYAIELQFFQGKRDYFLGLEYTTPDGTRGPIPVERLSIDEEAQPSWLTSKMK